VFIAGDYLFFLMEQKVEQSIRIYKLTDPSVWSAQQDAILSLIVKASGLALPSYVNPQIDFTINPLCGWIYYAVKNDLWLDVYKKGLSMKPDEVLKASNTFLENIKKECATEVYKKLKIPPLLPIKNAVIRHISTQAVPHHTKSYIDHWLVRYIIELKADNENGTPIMGSTIDIRVGNNNKVVFFSSCWRPTYMDFLETECIALDQELVAALTHTHQHEGMTTEVVNENMPHTHAKEHAPNKHTKQEEVKAPIVYTLKGESEIQNYITPFYMLQQGHHQQYMSASKYSLTIKIVQKNLSNHIVCQAVVLGGSGKYAFSWSVWQPDKVWDEGVQINIPSIEEEVGSAIPGAVHQQQVNTYSQVVLNPGVHNLIVIVIDKITGVFERFEQSIYTAPLVDTESLTT
jgi:hypothetical protein